MNRILLLSLITLFSFSCSQGWKSTTAPATYSGELFTTELIIFSPEIVRVMKYPNGEKPQKESLSVLKKPGTIEFKTMETEEQLLIRTTALEVRIDKSSDQVVYYDLEGNALLAEGESGVNMESFNDAGNATYTVRQTFVLDQDEHVYGLGQFQKGKMSQRNQKLELLQDNKDTAVPVMHSSKGYGVFWDNYSPTTFYDDSTQTYFESQVGELVDYYFMFGGNADGVIAQMRDLTGQAPMFPYWTYGYWQSKERYKSQQELVDVVKKYRELGVPLDGIIQDWQYWGDNYHWNAMEFLNPEFPEPKRMMDEIHELNAHGIISFWASFGPETKQYEILEQKGMLFDIKTWPPRAENSWPPKPDAKPSGVRVYDAYDPEARDIYWSHLKNGLLAVGMDGWWMDSTEPDHLDREELDYDQNTYLGTWRSVRNAFPLMTVGGVFEHQKATTEEKRIFILTRSAFAGQQRYGANSWSGDVVATWPNLRKQISAGLNFSMTGIPYWNSDIGGFFLWKFPNRLQNVAYTELYVRWLQFGAFCPMMRSHGTDAPREIWQFGQEGDWAYDAIKKFINLRYRLIPYIYATSWDVTENGSSMMRPFVMDFASDKKALDLDDQYMFGKSILVAPVTDPQYTSFDLDQDGNHRNSKKDFSSVKSSELYLPKGTKWIDFWTGESLDGGKSINRVTPIDLMPIYIKTGSILPLGTKVQYAEEQFDKPIELRVYPGADGTFTLYLDEGDNYNYEEGAYATIPLKWNDAGQTLEIGKREGSYKAMKEQLDFDIVLVSRGKGSGMETARQDLKRVVYTGDTVSVNL